MFSQQNTVKDSFAYYKEKHQYIKALSFSEKKSSAYLEQQKYPQYINQVLKSYDLLSNEIKDKKRSHKLIFNALNKTEKKASEYDRVKLLYCKAFRNIELQKYPQALKTLNQCLTIAKKTKNDTIVSKSYQAILLCFINTEKTDSIFKYLEPTLISAKKIGNNSFITNAYKNYHAFYHFIDESDIAKKYLDSALIYALKSGNKKTIYSTKNNFGVHYLTAEKNYQKAIQIYSDIIKETKNDTLLGRDYAYANINLSYAYEKLNDFKKAYHYQTQYVDYVDSLLLFKNDSQLEQMRIQYELDKAENQFQQKELTLKQNQLKKEKMLYLLIIVLTFIGILYYFFNQNIKLKQKNKLKDIQEKQQHKIVNATIDGQEEERKRLSSVLHDNISALLSSANLHLTAFELNHPETKTELAKTRAILAEAHDKVRDLSHDLIPPALEKLGLIKALNDLCEKNSNSIITFNFNDFLKEKVTFQKDFELKLYFIVAELFNNIIKHSKATEASLTVDIEDNQLLINIKDNGKGFNPKNNDEKGGYGLSQIQSRIKNLKGSISINSKENSGTLIYIKVQIPKDKLNAVS